jgi:hypothetical protein
MSWPATAGHPGDNTSTFIESSRSCHHARALILQRGAQCALMRPEAIFEHLRGVVHAQLRRLPVSLSAEPLAQH